MKPDFSIVANGQNITAKIKDRLERLTLTDQKGQKADRLEIVLDDREGLPLPSLDATLDVALGYQRGGLCTMGRFDVDEIKRDYSPAKLTITATAADMKKSFKQQKTRSFDQITLADLIKTIAQEQVLKAVVGASFLNEKIVHLDQTNESDMNLLTRLAQDYGAVAKPANGYLLFVPEGEAKSASGQRLAKIALAPGDVLSSSLSVILPQRYKYSAVTARWHDPEAATEKTVTLGAGTPRYSLKKAYATQAEASLAARAKLDQIKRAAAVLTFSCKGRSDLLAETPLSLAGFREGFDGEWIINEARHSIDNSGYRVSITAGLLKEK